MKRIFEVKMDQGLKRAAPGVVARLYGDATESAWQNVKGFIRGDLGFHVPAYVTLIIG